MLKKIYLIAALVIVTTSLTLALPEDKGLPIFEMDAPAPASNLWFQVGEVMHYAINWGIFNVGYTEVTTQWIKHEDGRTFLLIRLETHSNRVIEKLYPITDIQEAIIDPETFLPLYFYKKSQQGKRRYDELVTFDHANKKAYWDNYEANRKEVVDIEPDSRDIITTMYYLRSPERKLGKENTLRVYTDEKMYDMFVKVLKHEEIKLKRYGKVQSVKYEPIASFEGLFVSKGRMFMWVSEDGRRICTKLQATLPIADVRLVLKKVEGPGDDFWVADDEALKSRQVKKKKRRRRH